MSEILLHYSLPPDAFSKHKNEAAVLSAAFFMAAEKPFSLWSMLQNNKRTLQHANLIHFFKAGLNLDLQIFFKGVIQSKLCQIKAFCQNSAQS